MTSAGYASGGPLNNSSLTSGGSWLYATPPQTVYAPADLTIRELASTDRGDRFEYDITMEVCDGLVLGLAHMLTVSEEVVSKLGEPRDCETYDPGAGPITKCFRRESVEIEAGTVLGTVGHRETPYLDISALDEHHANQFLTARDVPYPRLHAVSALDLFTPEMRDQYARKVGRCGERRATQPLGGSLDVDLAGTAHGHWHLHERAREHGISSLRAGA